MLDLEETKNDLTYEKVIFNMTLFEYMFLELFLELGPLHYTTLEDTILIEFYANVAAKLCNAQPV